MKKIKKLRKSLSFNIISAVVLLLLIFSLIVSVIGYFSFTEAFKREYSTTTLHMARTAATLVKGDSIDTYLADGGENDEYQLSKSRLDIYCNKMNISLVYVIKVDTGDYNSFVSVFNSVNNSVANTNYSPWELGYKRETTNDEYKQAYKNIYENHSDGETIYRTSNLNGAIPHITILAPVNNSKGDVACVLCIQRPMSELIDGRKPYLRSVAISMIIMAILAAISYAIYMRREFVKPVKKIISEAERFASENTASEKLGDNTSNIDEISHLANSIDKMEEDMLRYINNLTYVTAEKERIGTELSVASTIQKNSVPNIFPAFVDRNEFDIYASMTPAKEVGGDFYNFFLIDHDHLAFTIADVSGKGVPAALFMMVTNILISDRARMGGTPAEILNFVNDRVCEKNPADMFVTVWLGILEISTGKLTYANAGHDDPAIYRNGGKFEIAKSRHGIVIGGMGGFRYKDIETTLSKGDKIFLYTDGVPEATDNDNNMFTIERMVDALNENTDKAPDQVLAAVRRSVDDFVGDAPQFDDLTMMCLEFRQGCDDMQTLVVDATNDNLPKVMEFIDSFLESNDCSMKAQTQLDLAVEEAFVNVANYAYGEDIGKVELSIKKSDNEVTIVLVDSGVPYNPLEKADPDITLSAEERKIGGLGIFLVKKNTDNVSYKYENSQNILTMKKII